MHRQIRSTRTHRKDVFLENHCQQIRVIAAFQPATSGVHERRLLCGITAPEVPLDALPSPPPSHPGDGFCARPSSNGQVCSGCGVEPGEGILSPSCPSTKWGLGEYSQGQQGPKATVAGIPHWNHLSAQIPRALRKQRGEAMSGEEERWAVEQGLLWRGWDTEGSAATFPVRAQQRTFLH